MWRKGSKLAERFVPGPLTTSMEPVEAKAASTPVTPKRMKRTFSSAGAGQFVRRHQLPLHVGQRLGQPVDGQLRRRPTEHHALLAEGLRFGAFACGVFLGGPSVSWLMSASRTSIAEDRIS